MKRYLNSCLRGQAIDFLFHLLITLIFFSSASYIVYNYYKKFDEIRGFIILSSFLNFVDALPKDPKVAESIKISVEYPVFTKGENLCTSYGKTCIFTYYNIGGILSNEIIIKGEEVELK